MDNAMRVLKSQGNIFENIILQRSVKDRKLQLSVVETDLSDLCIIASTKSKKSFNDVEVVIVKKSRRSNSNLDKMRMVEESRGSWGYRGRSLESCDVCCGGYCK